MIGRRRRGQLLILALILLVILLLYCVANSHDGKSSFWSFVRSVDKRDACVCVSDKQKVSKLNNCKKFKEISCDINQDVAANIGLPIAPSAADQHSKPYLGKISCRLDSPANEVYVPFSFLESYYEVSGGLNLNKDRLAWSHSYSRIFQHLKDKPYDVSGTFLQFSKLNVENRPRVKCTSAKHGIPVSTQWSKSGYYYPTQVCQYALAHWSKFKLQTGQKKQDVVYEDGRRNGADWVAGQRGQMFRVEKDSCLHFEDRIHLKIGRNVSAANFVLGFDLKLEDNVTVTLNLKVGKSRVPFSIKYVPTDDFHLKKQGSTILMGYGIVEQQDHTKVEDGNKNYENDWKRFTRDVANDLMKGLGRKVYESLMEPSKWIVLDKATFQGIGCLTNFTLFQSPASHLRRFFHAADWLIKTQDIMTGGWPVDVPFNEEKVKYPLAKEIPPGWNSAMGQGHAISVLTRAYSFTKDSKYLSAASRALDLFNYPSFGPGTRPGVMSKFMDKHVWYEEYPTEPSTFILNGFMYSLLGLYDFWKTASPQDEKPLLAERLFREGFASLKALLPLYDTGSGSVYDLRHFTMPGASPMLARWDYHSLHVNLLFVLSTTEPKLAGEEGTRDNFLLKTAKRWEGYMYGKKTGHN